MSTSISVPTGTVNGGTVVLTFATAASAAEANNVLVLVDKAGSALFVGTGATPPSTIAGAANEYLIAPGTTGSVTIPAGYRYIIDAATGPTTFFGGNTPYEYFVATSATSPSAGFLLTQFGGGGQVVAGAGVDTIVSIATSAGGVEVDGDATTTTFLSGSVYGGSGTVVGTGPLLDVMADNAVVFGTGTNVSLLNIGNQAGQGADTIVAGVGAYSIQAVASGGVYYDIAGPLEFAAYGSASTLVAGAYAATVFGGNGNSAFFLGAGNDEFVSGHGASTVIGSATAPDLFAFVAGQGIQNTGGSDVIFNFNSADIIALFGYGAAADAAVVANQTPIAGGLQLTLPDKTVISLAGISSLSARQVVGT